MRSKFEMHVLARLILLILASFGSSAFAEVSGKVSAGAAVANLSDGFGQISRQLGQTWVRLFFFSQPVSEDLKKRLAGRDITLAENYSELGLTKPFFRVAILFKGDPKSCDDAKEVSYGAIFYKTSEYPIALEKEGPLAISDGKIPAGALRCKSFNDGEAFSFSISGGAKATRGQFPTLISEVTSEIPLSWNLKGEIPIYDQVTQKQKLFASLAENRITNANVKDTLLVYTPAVKWLSLSVLPVSASAEDKADPQRRRALIRQALITFNFKLRDTGPKIDPARVVSLTLYIPLAGSAKSLSVPASDEVEGSYYFTGELKEGQEIGISLKGKSAASSADSRPGYEWDIVTKSRVIYQH